jgi:O-antigen/teichoic acid export membrane protein
LTIQGIAIVEPPKLAAHFGLLLFANAVSLGLWLLATAVIVRLLPVETYGTYRQLFLLYDSLYVFFVLGMSTGMSYFIPRLEEKYWLAFLTLITAVLAGSGLAMGLGLYWGRSFISKAFSNPSLEFGLRWFWLYPVFALPVSVVSGNFLISTGNVRAAAFGVVLVAVTAILAVLLPAIFKLDIAVVAGALTGVSAAQFLVLLGLAVFLYRRSGFQWPGGIIGSVRTYVLPLTGAVAVYAVAKRMDSYFVSLSLGPEQFAVYSVGARSIPFFETFIGTVFVTTIPLLSEQFGRGDHKAALEIWHGVIKKVLLVLIPSVGLIAVAARSIIVLLYTETYAMAVVPFLAYLLVIPLQGLLFAVVLQAAGKTRDLLPAEFLRMGILIFAFAAIRGGYLGLVGPAIAYLLAEYGFALYMLLRVRKMFNFPLVDILPWRYIGKLLVGTGAAAAAAIALTILRPQLAFGVIGLIGVAAVFTAGFALWARWSGLVGSDEVELVKKVFGGWVCRV